MWSPSAPHRYLFTSFSYGNRESFMPHTQDMSLEERRVWANIPRLVCDFRYLKYKDAKELEFNITYLLKLQERNMNRMSDLN